MTLKTNYKKISLICLGLSLAASPMLATAASGHTAAKGQRPVVAHKSPVIHAEKNKVKAQYLFVQQAGFAVVNRAGSDLNVTLNKISSPMIYFSDAPVRRAGKIDIENFIKAWRAQKNRPINLVLEGKDYQTDMEYRLAMTMSQVKVSDKGQRLSLVATPITPIKAKHFPYVLANVNVFIDGLPCGMEC